MLTLSDSLLSDLLDLEHSRFDFRLTGSRFFTPDISASADWDFFTQCSDEVHDWLLDHGYTERKSYSDDPHAIMVLEKGCIDIQLVDNALQKTRIQEVLLRHDVMPRFGKTTRQRLWALAYALLKST